ncbi:hypothetical protein [Nonomuraea roseoviolacea]|uniref:Uncharacterized protein n=1 Tax=Nonomuraea roseoviolacea subsp. carminata TaxID=160689 RepID=A0ABT1JY03_9ACTN|nr:hypothetical protein [Nonomuraea roseoviolacea]MCP2346631.1 hypothetical protein [Nonomuraea roseoviolacea subsp. carminata]
MPVRLDVPAPHFTDRVEQAQHLIASRDRTPDLADADRELLGDTLRRLRRVIGERGDGEQWLSQMRAALDGEGLERPDRPNRPEARR